ncbi:unnamed protein product [Ixodes pacificus]
MLKLSKDLLGAGVAVQRVGDLIRDCDYYRFQPNWANYRRLCDPVWSGVLGIEDYTSERLPFIVTSVASDTPAYQYELLRKK